MTSFIASKKITRRTRDATLQLPPSLHPVLANVLSARGLESAEELNYSLGQLLSYRHLSDIDTATALLFKHLEAQSHILIVADFDADGATSCALAMRGLRAMGAAKVSYVVPNRFEYGYGLTPEIVDVAVQQSPNLIITVDNGISSIEGVCAAREQGVDVLITDHHLPGEQLPNANAIINPNKKDDPFASKVLAGVGVMFYVLMALRTYLKDRHWFANQNVSPPNLAQWLDLLALGTVADVVPLDHNNRILVEQGLRRIRQNQCCPGISALLAVSGRNSVYLNSADLGFALGPRLNAAGRLEDMKQGIECLLCDNPDQAFQLAQSLDKLNQQRRDIQAQMKQEAMAQMDEFSVDTEDSFGICVYRQDWHQGIVGLVAAHVREHVHRPVIAFAPCGEGELKGSARSIPGLHIRDALDTVATRYPQLLSKFGGHAMAAGLSLREADYAEFAQRFNEVVRESLRDEDLQECIHSDGELQDEYLNLEAAFALRGAGPWGQHFPEPLFDGEFEIVQRRIVGEAHLKLGLRTTQGRIVEAIAFNTTDIDWPQDTKRVKMAYRLDINEYRGECTPQLIVEHIEPLLESKG